ncbi:(S)-ureidoglycine aminohydrolase-like [Bidens hawaiensis]|uniref:(S)-ureidoglycine aminohydrolase-like n=1 Tax=Bidens hawaiensis TaxID=980011 RepID=UPI004049448B
MHTVTTFIQASSVPLSPLIVYKEQPLGSHLVSPVMGAHFVISKSGHPSKDVERFAFVLQGSAKLINAFGRFISLHAPNSEHLFESYEYATLVVFERRYAYLENHILEPIVSSTNQPPLFDTPGEVFELRKLLLTLLSYDFNIHNKDFQPGVFLM